MAVKILKKIKTSASSSNQHTKIDASSFPIKKALDADNEVWVSYPFCDKIVLVGRVYPCDVAALAAQSGEDAETYLAELLKEASEQLKKDSGSEFHKPKKLISKYLSGQKRLGPRNATMAVSVSTGKTRSIRIEFNPRRFGKKGLADIADQWELLFHNEIAFETWLGRARVTRLDVAVDILNVHVADLFPLTQGHKAMAKGKWSTYASEGGGYETVSKFSGAKRKRVALCIYDKRTDLVEKKAKAKYGTVPHVRVERRLPTPKRMLFDLQNLKNPFSGWRLAYVPEAGCDLPPLWTLFVDSVRVRGLSEATELLPEADRESWAAALLDCSNASFWDPTLIWSKWKKGLSRQGLDLWIDAATLNKSAHCQGKKPKSP